MKKNWGHLIEVWNTEWSLKESFVISDSSTSRKENEKENLYECLLFLSRNLSVIHWSKIICRTLPWSSSLTENILRKWILLSCPDSWLKTDLLHPFLEAFIKATYWGWEGWFHISENSDRVGESKNAMSFSEREYIWINLLFLLGQKKHTKHFSHFNLQA